MTGEEIWEERVFSPIFGEGGEVKYVIESLRDVTRVKALEKKYSDVRQLIDKVVQSSVSTLEIQPGFLGVELGEGTYPLCRRRGLVL